MNLLLWYGYGMIRYANDMNDIKRYLCLNVMAGYIYVLEYVVVVGLWLWFWFFFFLVFRLTKHFNLEL